MLSNMCLILALVPLLAPLHVGARDVLTASAPTDTQAPAPATERAARANLDFVLTAEEATFKDGKKLMLNDPAASVPYFSGERVGVMPTEAFANGKLGSSLLSAEGKWLDQPQAILYGYNSTGGQESVALDLLSVMYKNETGAVKFHVNVVAPTKDAIKLQDGPVTAAVGDSEQGTGVKLATTLPTEAWTSVTLVIQTQRTALQQPAETKDWNGYNHGGDWGRNGGWDRGNHGGWGYGGGWGYNRPWWWG